MFIFVILLFVQKHQNIKLFFQKFSSIVLHVSGVTASECKFNHVFECRDVTKTNVSLLHLVFKVTMILDKTWPRHAAALFPAHMTSGQAGNSNDRAVPGKGKLPELSGSHSHLVLPRENMQRSHRDQLHVLLSHSQSLSFHSQVTRVTWPTNICFPGWLELCLCRRRRSQGHLVHSLGGAF